MNNYNFSLIGNLIKIKRLESKYSINEFCEKISITNSDLKNIENGDCSLLNSDLISNISKILNFNLLNTLYNEKSKPNQITHNEILLIKHNNVINKLDTLICKNNLNNPKLIHLLDKLAYEIDYASKLKF